MKKYFYLIVLTLILSLVLTGCLLSNVGQVPTSEQSGITYLTKAVPPSANLVGLWHFDGDTFDSSGNFNDGTLMGDTNWTSGKFGDALIFDGVDNYVSVDDSTSLSSIENGGTWELWIKPNSDLRAGKWIGFLDTAPGQVGAVQSLVDKSNNLRACFGGVFGAMWSIDSDWTGQWHHIVGTWNQKVNPTVTLYVDGVQKAQATVSVTVRVDLLDIGRLNNGNNFNGIIDEVRIWDGALTAGEIAYNYNLEDVPIDIKPGSFPNSVNLKDQGLLPVAILGNGVGFDVSDVNPETIQIGSATLATRGSAKAPKLAYSYEDVNVDGHLDLIAFFSVPELVSDGVLYDMTAELTLMAELYDGRAMTGTDSVRIVPPE